MIIKYALSVKDSQNLKKCSVGSQELDHQGGAVTGCKGKSKIIHFGFH